MPAVGSWRELAQEPLPTESESSDTELLTSTARSAAHAPRACAAAPLAVAAAALVLLAVAWRSAGAAAGAVSRGPRGHDAVVSMLSNDDISELSTSECVVYGFSNVEYFGTTEAAHFSADPGWIWLVESSTVHLQGLMGELDDTKDSEWLVLKEITIGGPSLQGGVLHITAHTTTWYPPSGSKQVILTKDKSKWSAPGILEASFDHHGDKMVQPDRASAPMHVVHVKVGAFFVMEVDLWNDDSVERFMNLKLVMPVRSSDKGLCVNDLQPVSEPDDLAIHHSPSPTGDTSAEADSSDDILAEVASSNASHHNDSDSNGNSSNSSYARSGSTASNSPDKSGAAVTFLYFALSLGFANSIVPFVL